MKSFLQIMLLLSFATVFPNSAYAVDGDDTDQSAAAETYIIFFSFTAQGVENIEESPARVEAARQTVESMGGRVMAFYGMLGSEFDTLFIVEAPDDETVSKMVLAIASGGNVRTRTHRLFTEEQYRAITSSVP